MSLNLVKLFIFMWQIFAVYSDIPPPEVHWFTQRVDHYNQQNSRTFEQKYLVYNGSWDPANNGPIFFYAGNESPIEQFWYGSGFMFDISKEFGALIVFMELRYYGASLPFGNNSFTLQNLTYSTLPQAVQDYAQFMTSFKSFYSASNSSVIAFGGSLGGILSAALRIHHPEVFDIALASSAPIPQMLNQSSPTSFFQHVTDDYYNANKECPDIVRAGYSQLIDMGTNSNNYKNITETFSLCNDIKNVSDITHLQYWIRNGLLTMAQFDYPYATDYASNLPANPVNVACNILLDNKSNPLYALAKSAGLFYNASTNYTLKCFDQFEEYVFCSDQTGCGSEPNGVIMDDYGSCTTGGGSMNTNNVTDMFPPTIWEWNNLTQYCNEKYGLQPNIEWMKLWYPLNIKNTGITNIIFSNGELDPFIGGGYTQNVTDKLPAIVIANAAHHLDLRGKNPNDPVAVTQARQLEVQYFKQWLSETQKTK